MYDLGFTISLNGKSSSNYQLSIINYQFLVASICPASTLLQIRFCYFFLFLVKRKKITITFIGIATIEL